MRKKHAMNRTTEHYEASMPTCTPSDSLEIRPYEEALVWAGSCGPCAVGEWLRARWLLARLRQCQMVISEAIARCTAMNPLYMNGMCLLSMRCLPVTHRAQIHLP